MQESYKKWWKQQHCFPTLNSNSQNSCKKMTLKNYAIFMDYEKIGSHKSVNFKLNS